MDDVTSLRIFLEVARRQSFSATADHFGISRSAVSKHVASLERDLKARLLNRTTKQMHLTRAGAFVAERGPEVLMSLDDLKGAVGALTGEVSGLIRVGAAPYFGSHRLVPMIASFCREYRDVQISLTLLSQSRIEDFVGTGLDVGVVNSSSLPDMTHSAYTVADMPQATVASPGYLKTAPALEKPEDLVRHECLVNSFKSQTGTWRFTANDDQTSVRVRGRFRSSYGDSLKHAAVHGMGVSVHPRYMVEEELRSGSLVEVLPAFAPEMLRVYALYSGRGRIPQHVRVFIESMRKWHWNL